MAYKFTICYKSLVTTFSALILFLPSVSLTCLIRRLFCEKALSQWLHWYGFSSVCVRRCFVRSQLWMKALSHWVHWYGFSPVCVSIWLSRTILHEKPISHWEHLNGFSPVWVIICSPKTRFCGKSFLTVSALIRFTPSMSFHMHAKITTFWKS